MCVTIFSTGGKFRRFDFYVVTRSYSSHLFLCTLDVGSPNCVLSQCCDNFLLITWLTALGECWHFDFLSYQLFVATCRMVILVCSLVAKKGLMVMFMCYVLHQCHHLLIRVKLNKPLKAFWHSYSTLLPAVALNWIHWGQSALHTITSWNSKKFGSMLICWDSVQAMTSVPCEYLFLGHLCPWTGTWTGTME